MENDENTDEVQVVQEENQEGVVEETTPEEVAAPIEPALPKEEGVMLSPAEFRHYNKWKNSQNKPQASSPQSSPAFAQHNVEETILLANGMSEELVKELKAVAKARGINSLLKAKTDPIFVAVQEKFEKDLKQREASLPASRGSGGVKAQKSVDSPGLARDEHRRLVQESLR